MVGKDGDLLDELFDQSLIKLCDVGFLLGDEVLQLFDLVHGFFPVMADELGLFFLVAKPEDQISQNAKVFIEEMKANKKEITVIEYPNAVLFIDLTDLSPNPLKPFISSIEVANKS